MGAIRQQTSISAKPIIWYGVDDITGLKAITLADRAEKQLRLVKDSKTIFFFDASSVDVPDDFLVVKPDDITLPAPGRWIRTTANSVTFTEVIDVVSNGQTSFELSYVPVDETKVLMVPIGGPLQAYAIDFTIASKTITWLSSVAFESGEKIVFTYEINL